MSPGRRRAGWAKSLILCLCTGLLWYSVAPQALAQTEDFQRAVQEYRLGQQDRAMTSLQAILREDPDYAPAHELLGLILTANSDHQKALSHLLRAAQLWPNHAVYQVNLAVFYLRQLRIKDAEVVLEHSLNSAPSPQAYRLLGVIRLDQQRAQAAIRLFREATALAPRELAGWYDLGLAYEAISDTDSALMCYGQALQLDPKDFATHRQIGLANLDRGHAAEARDHLHEASTLQPEDGEVAMYLSQAYLYAGDLENASESAKRAARLLPDDPRSHYQLGLVLARSEMMNESAKEFELSERLPRKLAVGPLERWRQLSEKRKRIVPDSDARP